jgi:hypothetical protein
MTLHRLIVAIAARNKKLSRIVAVQVSDTTEDE